MFSDHSKDVSVKILCVFLFVLGHSAFSFGNNSVTFPEGAGSNFVFYDLGKYAKDPTPENWPEVKVVLLHYHTYQNQIRSRLKTMRANGQTKISLFLWYVEDGAKCVSFNHVICPQNGMIPQQVQKNISNILKDIVATGFDTVVLRMGAQSVADPMSDNYVHSRANDSWKLFENFYAISEKALAGSKVKSLYDLSVEIGGHPHSVRPGAQHFMKTMWNNYIKKYPPYKTVGFSFNHAHEKGTKETLKIYKDSGVWPYAIGVDMYQEPEKFLKNLARELKNFKIKHHPLIIVETYRNSPEMAKAFKKASEKHKLNFLFVLQWPLDLGSKSPHSNDPLTNHVYHYVNAPLPLDSLPVREPNPPQIKSSGIGCEDRACLWIKVKRIERGSYVDIRFVDDPNPIAYRGSDLVVYPKASGTHEITLRLKSARELQELRSRGLRLWVVNPNGRTWSPAPVTVRESVTPISGGHNFPGTNFQQQ